MAKSANNNEKSTKTVHKVSNIGKKQKNQEKYFHSESEDGVIVSWILEEFEKRKKERKSFDLAWELNINFLLGNQFSYIAENGEIERSPKAFYWQGEEVYNHISPIVETRLAKLGKVRPTVAVRPCGAEEKDVYNAKLTKNILSIFASRHKLAEAITEASIWSEVTGTAFYKVVWNSEAGEVVGEDEGKSICLGDVNLHVCSPFEIFPDSAAHTKVSDCESIIHARAIPAGRVKDMFGIDVEGVDLDTYSFDQGTSSITFSGKSNVQKLSRMVKHDHVLVLEYYEKSTRDNPKGKFVIVAGDKLVFDGEVPYVGAGALERCYPFVKQVSNAQIGCFWGVSVIERCIPIQRAYNAIKNRKHEFLTRLACGVLAVEDGSVDIDNLEEDGLAPGKIVVYRNGSTPPRFLDEGSIPSDFSYEEDKLLSEFITVSGVSELMRDSAVPSSVSSGTALSLLIEQDETRLSVSAEYIRSAVKEIAEHVVRLYKQFASTKRLSRVIDENGDIELYYWNNSDIQDEEIILESDNELSESPAQRKSLLLELYRAGLFAGSDGKVDARTRNKILVGLGFNSYDNIQDISALHIKRATKENLALSSESLMPLDIDDHELHIAEHSKFLISDESKGFGEEHIQNLKNHILEHKVLAFAGQNFEDGKNQV